MHDYEAIKELAQEKGLRVTDLLALSPKNDPCYAGTETDWKQARWFEKIWKDAGYTGGVHLRRAHYFTVSQRVPVLMHNGQPYQNTDACWKYLTQASKMARYLGLVEIGDIVDNKNPPANVHTAYSDASMLSFEFNLPDLDSTEIQIYGPYISTAQPYHLEVWCEKSTMNSVLLPVCQRYLANLVTFEGEVSLTACNTLLSRIKDADEKPVRIFYISDFDPAGMSMPVATSRKIEWLLDQQSMSHVDLKLRPLALNGEQVRHYNLPRTPIKATERRAGKFEEANGEGACELDALEALYPGALGRLVHYALGEYYSEEAANYARQQVREMRELIAAKRDVVLAKYAQEIEAVKGMMTELRAIEIEETFDIATANAEVYEDDSEWLLDMERDYVEQIGYYKRHKGLDAPEDLE